MSIRYPKRTLTDELKRVVRERDNNQCVWVGCPSHNEQEPTLNIHHVLPEQYGGSDEPSNLVTLCVPHHKAAHVEFSGYYGDSASAFAKMLRWAKGYFRKVSANARFGIDFDHREPLKYLTGHSSFRGGQDEAFRAVMQGQDVLFVAPTGIGKSIIYQLPGLLRARPTLVISPLKSLMVDQVQKLMNKYIPATYINSDLGTYDKQQRMKFIAMRLIKFVYVAPERYYKSKDSAEIFSQPYGLFVVDEAHCIDKWGRNFRESYAELGGIREALGCPQTIAVTASASVRTQQEIIRSLGLVNPVKIVKGFYRPNITIVTNLHEVYAAKEDQLKHTLQTYGNHEGKTILYVTSVKQGHELQETMKKLGYRIPFYCSRLDAAEKNQIQARFSGARVNDPIDTVIATSAFGMGIDVSNVRLVIHWNMPANIEDYYQQIGRAGRDGGLSHAVLLYANGDEGLPQYMNRKSVAANNNLDDTSKAQLNEVLDHELKMMKRILREQSPWGYINSYFGETTGVAGIVMWWRYVLVAARHVASAVKMLVQR